MGLFGLWGRLRPHLKNAFLLVVAGVSQLTRVVLLRPHLKSAFFLSSGDLGGRWGAGRRTKACVTTLYNEYNDLPMFLLHLTGHGGGRRRPR